MSCRSFRRPIERLAGYICRAIQSRYPQARIGGNTPKGGVNMTQQGNQVGSKGETPTFELGDEVMENDPTTLDDVLAEMGYYLYDHLSGDIAGEAIRAYDNAVAAVIGGLEGNFHTMFEQGGEAAEVAYKVHDDGTTQLVIIIKANGQLIKFSVDRQPLQQSYGNERIPDPVLEFADLLRKHLGADVEILAR